jgi:2-polyprenyl-6-methoxyphenol hydroxylase-like FAD-dependent oxidoreductase
LERRAYLHTLYDKLPDKSKVIEGARIVDIIEENDQVRAILADGTEHTGDIIAGCDGVHSGVREIMWRKAHELSPGLITVQEKHAIKTTYNGLVGIAPFQPGLGTQDMTCVSNDRFSFLFLTQPDAIYFIVHCKLPGDQVVKYPNRLRYTEADADAKAAELADYPISDTLVFGDVWKTRTRGQLVSLEEGILSHWSFGRTVLVGDAAHKVTPNAALGGNLATEGAVQLANELYALVKSHPNKKPTTTEFKAAFQKYQQSHMPRVEELFNISWMMTRMQAFDGWVMFFLQRWVLP